MTEEEKESRIELLKDRTSHCVCKYCGGELEVRQIIFYEQREARVELFCTDCDRIEYGVEREIYDSAKYFVNEMEFNHYPDLDENEKTRQMNVAKICDILTWGSKSMGFLEDGGFVVPVNMNRELLGKSIILDEESLAKLLQEVKL